MLRRLRWFATLNHRNSPRKTLPNATPRFPELAMFDAVHEIAVYIHRFHNLDLFQQGWYQLKITMRWEDSDTSSLATPARVVQYEAPDLRPDDVLGVWKIDDLDNSFSTQPFRIKYARQDVLLSVMVAFNLSLSKFEGLSTSPVIIKFELMYAPMLENRSELQDFVEAYSAAVHEFRIPPKALLGLHSYCPVHFDAFHAALVDMSVHATLLKSILHTFPMKISRNDQLNDFSNECAIEDAVVANFFGSNQATCHGAFVDTQHISLLKALLAAHNILLEELQRLSKGIDQAIDLTDSAVRLDAAKSVRSFLHADLVSSDAEVSRQVLEGLNGGYEEANGTIDARSDGLLLSLPKDDLMNAFNSLGSQVLLLWNTFLKFHRANKIKLMEFLRDAWASDRRAEWSIWMIYSKVDMPHHYLSSGANESSFHSVRGKASSLRKLNIDPCQTAAMRAELHRRSITQMNINSQSIQDMHLFGDPSRVPVLIVEHVVNSVLHTTSGNSYLNNLDRKDGVEVFNKSAGSNPQQNGVILRIVVFVHGFQGHHLDLRLLRNQWLLIDPKVEFLMSEVNEERTSGDFREMGLRLAQEVTAFLKKKMDKVSRSGPLKNIKLSFVGHSIGNIIVRAALAESIMEPFLLYLHAYVSISGPHLGYLYSSNVVFNSGLWLLKKLKGTQCIHQLTLTDDPDLENTFFYKLCKQKTLENFRNVILLSSPQDGYVPYHSARIELCRASSWDYTKRGKVFLEMLNNCLDQIRAPSTDHRVFMRCDVNFNTSSHGRNLNTFIGRAAHIEFLESDVFAKFIMWSFPELFR